MPYRNPEDLRMSTARYRASRRKQLSDNQRAYYAKNRSKYLKDLSEKRRKDPRPFMLRAARNRATARGLPFDLELSDIQIPDVCPVFGTAFVFGHPELSASLDRLVPSRGYVKGNVTVISRLANTIKNCSTPAQIRRVSEWMEANVPQDPQ